MPTFSITSQRDVFLESLAQIQGRPLETEEREEALRLAQAVASINGDPAEVDAEEVRQAMRRLIAGGRNEGSSRLQWSVLRTLVSFVDPEGIPPIEIAADLSLEGGVLIFPAASFGHSRLMLDLNIPGFDPPRMETVQIDQRVQLNFSWGDSQILRLLYNPEDQIFICQAQGVSINGVSFQYETTDVRGLDQLAEVVDEFSFYLMLGIPTSSLRWARKMSDAQVGNLLKRGKRVTPDILRYEHLGDKMQDQEISGLGRRAVNTEAGIHSWGDLEEFISQALTRDDLPPFMEIVVHPSDIPTTEDPPQTLLVRLAQRVASRDNFHFTLILEKDLMDPPILYRFGPQGMECSKWSPLTDTIPFWKSEPVQRVVTNTLQTPAYIDHRLLYESLFRVHAANPQGMLDEFLIAVIDDYNQNANATNAALIPDDHLLAIYNRIHDLRAAVRGAVEERLRAGSAEDIPLIAGALYCDPIDLILREHPPLDDPMNHVISNGGGAMSAILDLTRDMINRRTPNREGRIRRLDMRMTVFDISSDLVSEVNQLGTNRVAFGDDPINPHDNKALYYTLIDPQFPALKMVPYFLRRGVGLGYFNLKAGDLPSALLKMAPYFAVMEPVPVLAMPAKAYDEEGKIPYWEAFKTLVEAGYDRLAYNLLVEAGYFSARDIMRRIAGYMTLSSHSREALEIFAWFTTPQKIGSDDTADWDRMHMTFLEGKETAAFLMAGGANKNFLTYFLARYIMEKLLNLTDAEAADERVITALQGELDQLRERNIEISEEIIARMAPSYGLKTDRVRSPLGLKMDIRKCAPESIRALLPIRQEFAAIIALTNPRQIIRRLEQLTTQIADAYYELIGTRNAMDGDEDAVVPEAYRRFTGYIDSVIDLTYRKLQREGKLPPGATRFAAFYQRFYPKKFTGKGAPEGRQLHRLTKAANAQEIVLPGLVTRIDALYGDPLAKATDPIPVTQEQMRDYVPPDDATVHPLWGLPDEWVEDLWKILHQIQFNLEQVAARRVYEYKPAFFTQGLMALYMVLARVRQQDGVYPEVTRRILVVRDTIGEIIAYLNDAERSPPLSQTALRLLASQLYTSIVQWAKVFTRQDLSVTNLLQRLRWASQTLDQAEKMLKDPTTAAPSLGVEASPGGSDTPTDNLEYLLLEPAAGFVEAYDLSSEPKGVLRVLPGGLKLAEAVTDQPLGLADEQQEEDYRYWFLFKKGGQAAAYRLRGLSQYEEGEERIGDVVLVEEGRERSFQERALRLKMVVVEYNSGGVILNEGQLAQLKRGVVRKLKEIRSQGGFKGEVNLRELRVIASQEMHLTQEGEGIVYALPLKKRDVNGAEELRAAEAEAEAEAEEEKYRREVRREGIFSVGSISANDSGGASPLVRGGELGVRVFTSGVIPGLVAPPPGLIVAPPIVGVPSILMPASSRAVPSLLVGVPAPVGP